ncbi:MAG: hypothetical protein ABI239_00285 [Aquihabitans sp.]
MTVTEKHETGGRAVVFDESTGRLIMGEHSRQLPAEPSNRTVLERYVDLVGESRGRRMIDTLHLREEDLDALSKALDLDAARLVTQIEAVLGATPDEARGLLARLREHRLSVGVAVVAVAAVVAGGALAASVGGSDPAPAPAPVAAVAAPTASAADLGAQIEPPLIDGEIFDIFDVELAPAVSVVAPGAEGEATSDVTPDPGTPTDVDNELTITEEGVGLIPPISIVNPDH